MRWLAAGGLDLFLPGVCMACSTEDACEGGLCRECNLKLLAVVSSPYCPRCGTGLPVAPTPRESCQGCPQPLPRFESVVRLGSYAPPLRAWCAR